MMGTEQAQRERRRCQDLLISANLSNQERIEPVSCSAGGQRLFDRRGEPKDILALDHNELVRMEWHPLHANQFVVIKSEDVLGFSPTIEEALSAGTARYGLDSFLVRQVGTDEQVLTAPALTLGLLSAHH